MMGNCLDFRIPYNHTRYIRTLDKLIKEVRPATINKDVENYSIK